MDRATEQSVTLLHGALSRQPEFIAQLVDHIAGIFWSTDTNLRFTACIGAGLTALDLRPDQIVGTTLGELWTPDNSHHAVAVEGHRRALLGEACTYEVEYRDHVFRGHVEPLRAADGTICGCLGMALDITDSRESERRLQAKYAITHIMAEAATPEQAIPQILHTLCATFGWSWGEFWEIEPASDRLRLLECWHDPGIDASALAQATRMAAITRSNSLAGRAAATGQATWVADIARETWSARAPLAMRAGFHAAVAFPVIRHTTVVGVMEFLSRAIREPDDNVLGMMAAVGHQIGELIERKRAEEALRMRDRAIEAFVQGVVITDPNRPDNPIVYANQAFCRLTGYRQEEIQGRNCRFLQGPRTDPAKVAEIRAAIQEERACLVELLNYRKDGSPFWNALSLAPVHDAEGRLTHFVGVQTDITAVKRLEEQYQQAQKMEAIGQLAGGIAHDFNNLLTVISGYSELLLQQLPPDDPQRDLIGEVHRAGERAAHLTRQLLAFGRKAVIEPRVLDVNAIVLDTERMLRRLIGEDIVLASVPAVGLRPVKADAGQLEQIIVNLAVNARDAMPTGGNLTIETANVELDDGYTRLHAGVKPGRYVMLAVSDTGCGMSDQTKAHIFEPFFTTKGPGKGTGLGLATVYGIVKQAGGHIGVYSELGRGTTFKVYLPPAAERVASTTAQHGLRTAPRGHETIVLVEDEDAVRGITRLALETHGYHVVEARNGREALRHCDAYNGPIHLLITDAIMPDMGGRELAERVAISKPGTRVLYLSGYADEAVVRHGILHADVAFLQKPFTPLALAHKVREVLDG